MLLAAERRKLSRIQNALKKFTSNHTVEPSNKEYRLYLDTLREGARLFDDVVVRLNRKGQNLSGEEGQSLRDIVAESIRVLGGSADPTPVSLKHYQHDLHGPFLGVSDEGSAGSTLRRAALSSPKAQVLSRPTPLEIGVALDAERLAAVGEVAVGPDEYRKILLECQGSLLKTTNVGTRLNLRYFKLRPIIEVDSGKTADAVSSVIDKAKSIIEPFWNTPDGKAKPLTVFIHFAKGISYKRREQILAGIIHEMKTGKFCEPAAHQIGLLFTVSISRSKVPVAIKNIDLASAVGIKEVAVQGIPSWASENKISMPGLLDYFSPAQASRIMEHARSKGVLITPKNQVDPGTVARHVWSGLQTARNMGLELGKYGLFPLTMEESGQVVSHIQQWFSDWSAAPVFYVDFPAIGADRVYSESQISKALKSWLDCISEHRIEVVLIDTADKDRQRKILKQNSKDPVGIFTIGQIRELDRYARDKGIRCLWAGGITLPQAYEFGKLGVFGIYVTSAAASSIPTFGEYADDPMLVSVKEPTLEGVYFVKLLLEAGFIVSRLLENGENLMSDAIDKKARELSETLGEEGSYPKTDDPEVAKFHNEVAKGWKFHYKLEGYSKPGG